MSTKPFKIEQKTYGTIEWRRIKAYQARNFDGTLANWQQGTPSGDRELIEKRFIPKDKNQPIRYTNYW